MEAPFHLGIHSLLTQCILLHAVHMVYLSFCICIHRSYNIHFYNFVYYIHLHKEAFFHSGIHNPLTPGILFLDVHMVYLSFCIHIYYFYNSH